MGYFENNYWESNYGKQQAQLIKESSQNGNVWEH